DGSGAAVRQIKKFTGAVNRKLLRTNSIVDEWRSRHRQNASGSRIDIEAKNAAGTRAAAAAGAIGIGIGEVEEIAADRHFRVTIDGPRRASDGRTNHKWRPRNRGKTAGHLIDGKSGNA